MDRKRRGRPAHTDLPDGASIRHRQADSNTENSVNSDSLRIGEERGRGLAGPASGQAGESEADSAEPWRMSCSETSISSIPNARITWTRITAPATIVGARPG